MFQHTNAGIPQNAIRERRLILSFQWIKVSHLKIFFLIHYQEIYI